MTHALPSWVPVDTVVGGCAVLVVAVVFMVVAVVFMVVEVVVGRVIEGGVDLVVVFFVV